MLQRRHWSGRFRAKHNQFVFLSEGISSIFRHPPTIVWIVFIVHPAVSQSFFYWTLESIFIFRDLVRWATMIIGRSWLQTNTWECGWLVRVDVLQSGLTNVANALLFGCRRRDDNNNNSSILGFVLGVCQGLYTTSGAVLCSHVLWMGERSEEEIVFSYNFT